jgi:LysM repeat protein
MKLPAFLRSKPKRLRTATARKPLRIAASATSENMAEPNMKLTRALLIVLLLHVVAVSGIIAFNAIKTRQSSGRASTAAIHSNSSTAPRIKSEASPVSFTPVQKEITRRDQTKSSRSAGKQSAREDRKSERSRSGGGANADSGKVYVVAKGDNPVSIAKKLKVSYDDLLALNPIDDPHKLQVGQKLLVPSKTVKAKKADE